LPSSESFRGHSSIEKSCSESFNEGKCYAALAAEISWIQKLILESFALESFRGKKTWLAIPRYVRDM
jgi:hypothetical protein